MTATHETDQAGDYVNEHYRKVAARWRDASPIHRSCNS